MLSVGVALVWLVHGLYNKLLGGSPRHLAIIQSVPGLDGSTGEQALVVVAVAEIAIALWVLSGWNAHLCAAVQTVMLLAMNAVELSFARSLLLWPAGLIPTNLAFLACAWAAAECRQPGRLTTWLRRHPIPIEAHLQDCLTLTYALPQHVLRPLIPPGLELETFNGYGLIAVALVQTRSLRPAGMPELMGQDFFLAGYRVFTTFQRPDGVRVRGLRILRSDANRARMVIGGNLLTHYNYHRCESSVDAWGGGIRVNVRSHDGCADLDVYADLTAPLLPPESPFASVREARRFAGPLPFTFDYEPETHTMIAIHGRRTNWRPAPVAVKVGRLSFFDQAAFHGSEPILAAAFHLTAVNYRWERGVRWPLRPPSRVPTSRCGAAGRSAVEAMS
jgi:hypothetical protein